MQLKGITALVTGADGFIGSHLVEVLHEQGARVRALAQYNSFNSCGWLDEMAVSTEVDIRSGDIRDPHFCKTLASGADIVFHLAALIGIPYSYVAPGSYIDTNVTGTMNICQAALEAGCSRVIITSTSEVYGTARYVPIDEKHPLQPQSPYSASKIGADNIALSFFNAFDLPVTIARPFNTYGPRQSARAIIPTIITQMAVGKREIQLGDLTPTRDLNYVTDTCTGFIALATCDASVGETVNIGSGREIAMAALFEKIGHQMKVKAVPISDTRRLRPQKSEVRRLCCDNSKISAMTGWSPAHSLNEGLQKTIEWYCRSDRLNRYKTDAYNV
jgi:NAD dependent epimerase/dehydratase